MCRLEWAIRDRSSHSFESTLGGHTIPALLVEAASAGIEILVWFLGLSSPDQHIARVHARVAQGGHAIPNELIRKRWDASRRNLIAQIPHLAELKVFDNSKEGNPAAGTIPSPRLLLHWRSNRRPRRRSDAEHSRVRKTNRRGSDEAAAIIARLTPNNY